MADCLLQLSTFGRLPHFCLKAVKPFDFSEGLLKYQSPLSLVLLKRSGGGLSLLFIPTAALPGCSCSSSFRPCFFLIVLAIFFNNASLSFSGMAAILCKLSCL